MSPKANERPTIDVVVTDLIQRLPAEAKQAMHEAPRGSAHKLRAIVKVCARALLELENEVLWRYEKTLVLGRWPTYEKRQQAAQEMLIHFDPLVDACIDLIRAETAVVNGLPSLPFVLGLFETKRLSVLAAIHHQVLGLGSMPPASPVLEPS
jgi:hypothetical protein